MPTLATLLRQLPKPDAPIQDRADATEALAKAYAAEVGSPVFGQIRILASTRISSPKRPPLPPPRGFSRFWPDLEDDPLYAKEWAADDELETSSATMNRERVARETAAATERQRETDRLAEEQRQADLSRLTADLRRRYVATGATEAEADRAMPALIEDHRRRLLQDEATADDIARRAQAARTRL